MIDTYIIDKLQLTDEQLKKIEEKYNLLEPLTADYTSPEEKQQLRIAACEQLKIKPRTLRTYIKDFKHNGINGLIRKIRNDSGKNRIFDNLILNKSLELLKQNPYRSVNMLIKLMDADPIYHDKVKELKSATLYHHIKKSGYNFKNKRGSCSQKVYRSFEADFANQLWQGDARHGIPVAHPTKHGKTKMTYLYLWIDDFSRKIIFAKYFFDEKLPRLEECLRQAILRWGIPEKIYVDNGATYISKKFTCVVNAIGIRKIHHPPYRAWCKGKCEKENQTIKRFQEEARLAGIKTIDELNNTLWAWIEIERNQKIHSSTGETPNARFQNSTIKYKIRKIDNYETFNSYFLWEDYRIISKYGLISINNNTYRIRDIGIAEKVKVLFDPYDMNQIYIYFKEKYHSMVKAYKMTNDKYKSIPEENKKKNEQISKESRQYFEKLREKHLKEMGKDSNAGFSNIITEEKND